MRVCSLNVFSVQNLVVSLVSLNALTTTYAAPLGSKYRPTLGRRNTITVGGITAVTGEQLTSPGRKKSQVFRLKQWGDKVNPGYVIKTYNGKEVPAREVFALDKVKQLIASDKHSIVMKEVRGSTLAKLMKEITDHKERKKFWTSLRPKVAKAIAEIARTKGILHDDGNMENILIDGGNVHLIDWETWTGREEAGFTDSVDKIEAHLSTVIDSSGTPPMQISSQKSLSSADRKSQAPNSKSPGSKSSPGRKSRAPSPESPSQKGSSVKAGSPNKP